MTHEITAYPKKIYLRPRRTTEGGHRTGLPSNDWSEYKEFDPLSVEYVRADIVAGLQSQIASLIDQERRRHRLRPGEDEYDHRHWM